MSGGVVTLGLTLPVAVFGIEYLKYKFLQLLTTSATCLHMFNQLNGQLVAS